MTDFEIHIIHDTPVSLRVLSQTVEVISGAAFSVNMKLVDALSLEFPDITEEKRLQIESFIRDAVHDTLWLTEVEEGSSKLKGKFAVVAGAAIGIIIGNPVKDVIKDTKIYKDFVTTTAGSIDHFSQGISDEVRAEIERLRGLSPSYPNIYVEIVGESVRFYVQPSKWQLDISRME